jgi:hypothetical protein
MWTSLDMAARSRLVHDDFLRNARAKWSRTGCGRLRASIAEAATFQIVRNDLRRTACAAGRLHACRGSGANAAGKRFIRGTNGAPVALLVIG